MQKTDLPLVFITEIRKWSLFFLTLLWAFCICGVFFLYERNLIKFISAFFDIKEEKRSLDLSNDECVWYKAQSLWTGFFICKALLSFCVCWSQHITYTYLLVKRTILSVLFTQTATISWDKVEGNCCCQRGQYTCYRINNQ